MNNSKIEIAIGEFRFTGEGEAEWLSIQLDKILRDLQKIMKTSLDYPTGENDKVVDGVVLHSQKNRSDIKSITLAQFLKDHDAIKNQTRKFLATSVYLNSKGKKELSTSDITKALRDAGQNKLNNASDGLLKNIKKGLLERLSSSSFMVTAQAKEIFNLEF